MHRVCEKEAEELSGEEATEKKREEVVWGLNALHKDKEASVLSS